MSILRNGLLPSISGKTDKFKELLDLHYIDHVPFVEISKKIGVPSATLHRWIRTFEDETPELSSLMRKNAKEITPSDYKSLQAEISKLKKELADERPHWSIDGMTPAQASKCSGEISKMWTSYRDIAIKANEEKVSGGALCVQPAACTHMSCQPRQ